MYYTFQDISGSALAFLIFPVVLVFPGYVISWKFDLFDFKQRQEFTKYAIALLVSVAVVPILVYLLSILTSINLAKLILVLHLIIYISIVIIEQKNKPRNNEARNGLTRYQKLTFIIAVGWVAFLIISLMDLQLGNNIYFNVASYDFATRVSMVNAITRTGVPPVNPSFFPGHPAYITSVYYFWYIVCSLVDQFGGSLVDSRMVLIAGDAWCGLALMSLTALYLKFRNNLVGNKAWRTGLIGIGLLTISGLDVIPVIIDLIITRSSYGFMWPPGDIERWNTQVTAWVGSLFWVPHHVAAMIACITGFLLFQYANHKTKSNTVPIVMIVGLTIASAVGLSTWVTIIFAIFWGFWILILLIQNGFSKSVLMMILVGFLALIFASLFLFGVIKGGTGASGLPIAIEVRRFTPLIPYINLFLLSNVQKDMLHLMLLPINYLLELGVFLVIGLLWCQQFWNKKIYKNPYHIPEIILLCVVFMVCSFVRSAILSTNDLGWRGWLFGQFILLIWAIDIHSFHPQVSGYLSFKYIYLSPKRTISTNKLLMLLLFIGLSTSILDVVLLRFYPILVDKGIAGFPNDLSPDTQLGQRTFSSRLAYEFIRNEVPPYFVVQYNPSIGIERAGGLYGTRQVAISANTAYNVPSLLLQSNIDQISKIFELEDINNWNKIDALCQDFFIDVLVVNDLDPLWNVLPNLYQQRPPLYENQYYSVLACGNSKFER